MSGYTLAAASDCPFGYWICRETYVRDLVSARSTTTAGGGSGGGDERRRLWVIDIADLALLARAGTLMDMQKCKKALPQTTWAGVFGRRSCRPGVSKLVCLFREHVERRRRIRKPMATGQIQGGCFLVDVR